VKGYEIAKDEYVRFEPEELKALEQATAPRATRVPMAGANGATTDRSRRRPFTSIVEVETPPRVRRSAPELTG
jgi:hypothetical protein